LVYLGVKAVACAVFSTIRVAPTAGQPFTPLEGWPQQTKIGDYLTIGYTDSHCNTDGHRNHDAERYPYRYPKADADTAIRAHAQAASHPAAEALTVTDR
jgi:hypothetical protein